MGKGFYLGIDEGTTGVTAILFDEKWRQAARGYTELTQIYPRPGWVEHDPNEVWTAVLSSVKEALDKAGASAADIVCIGIDHEGETALIWDRITGEPVYNAIVWQDRRTTREAQDLCEQCGDMIRNITGLVPDSYYSATKFRWIMDNVPGVQEKRANGRLLAGNMDAWIAWKLTGVHATDASTASRTMLYDIGTGDWDDLLLERFGLDRAMMPEVGDSAGRIGLTEKAAFFGAAAPVAGLINDQQAALFGQACTAKGSIKTTYGTGCFMLMNTGGAPAFSQNGIITTVAWRLNNRLTFALDGGVYVAGAATQWLRDGLGLIPSASVTQDMALRVKNNGGVYFVPAFSGLAAPHCDPFARGMIIGLTGGTAREHIVRATLEATAYQVYDVLAAMKEASHMEIASMRCDGGATANGFLMQFQSDILGIPLDIPQISETTAFGAACMAALGAGELGSLEDVASIRRPGRSFEPRMGEDERMALLYDWHRAVERAKHWAE